jgi:CelD/BcsL family acetyltransferase involved in cellulose biosynthesis
MSATGVASTPRSIASAGAATRMSLPDALSLGSAVWDAVQARAASPSPFMSWAWHRAWADSAEDASSSEVLVLRDVEGEVQAILPLLLRRVPFHRVPVKVLAWAIGEMGYPDHLDVLATPEADLSALVPLVEELDWQVLVLSNLAPYARSARWLCAGLVDRGHTIHRQSVWPCPYLELSGDWEQYLATVTSSRRQALRHMERSLRRRHAVAITDYDGDRIEEGWRHLITLHEARWQEAGGTGAFRDPRIARLHRRFAEELARRGQLWLTTLDLDGAPAAAWYGFTCHDTVYFYQSGRDPRWERESVGQILIAAMIRRAMERGFRRFDFLRGDDPYKRQWTATRRITEEITIFRRGWRRNLLRGLDAVADLRTRLRQEKRDG